MGNIPNFGYRHSGIKPGLKFPLKSQNQENRRQNMRKRSWIAAVLIAALTTGSIFADGGLGKAFAQSYEGNRSTVQNTASPSEILQKEVDKASESNASEDLLLVPFDWEGTSDGYDFHIQAPKGVLPQGTKAEIRIANDGEYHLSKPDQDKHTGKKIDHPVIFDLSFWHEGEKIEPQNGNIKVTVVLDEIILDAEAYAISVSEDEITLLPGRCSESDEITFSIRRSGKYGFCWLTQPPAYHEQQEVDGVVITIDAKAGALPENTVTVITPVEQILTENQIVAFDIQFLADGQEIQPDSEVKVTFSMKELPENAEVFHISDEDKREPVSQSQQKENTIEFMAEHFSVYGIAARAGMSDDPLGNPLPGGTDDGDWQGHYVYYGWCYKGGKRAEHFSFMDHLYDELNFSSLYSWNGKKYIGSTLREPVKWRILNNDGNSILLLSDEILGVHAYDSRINVIPTWEDSAVREWLRDALLPEMFMEEEQALLCENLVTDKVPGIFSDIKDGNDTVDEIFLPSLEDMQNAQYGFPANGDSKARAAKYVNEDYQMNNTANDNSYWLRTRNSAPYGQLIPYHVTAKGDCIAGGIQYDTWNLGIRPMIRLDVENEFLCTSKDEEMLSYGLRFSREEETLAEGQKLTLILETVGLDFDLKKAEWGSSNENIIKVDNQGTITAVSTGTAYAFAHVGQHFAGCKVTVTPEEEVVKYNVVFRDGDKNISSQQVESGQAAIAPELAREGYELSWDKDFSNITSDLVVNAVWKAVGEYKINYILNGGINHPLNPSAYKIGTAVVFQRPSKEGDTFEGWYTTSDFQSGTGISMIPETMSGDITIYAKWAKLSGSTGSEIGGGTNIRQIRYELNGGTNHSQNPMAYQIGTAVKLEDPSRSGYTFKGWYTTPDFKTETQITAITETMKEDVTVYAKWEKRASGSGGGGGGGGGGGSSSSGGGKGSSAAASVNPAHKMSNGVEVKWEQLANGQWRLKRTKDNSYVAGWADIGNKWYFMNENGILTTKESGLEFPEKFYAQQKTGGNCTLFATINLLRSRAFIEGKVNVNTYSAINEESVSPYAWVENGLKSRPFTVTIGTGQDAVWYTVVEQKACSVTENSETKTKAIKELSLEQKKELLKELLLKHPEGIIIYDGEDILPGQDKHAALLTDYDADKGLFYVADSGYQREDGNGTRIYDGYVTRKELKSVSYFGGTGQDEKINSIDTIWLLQ